MVNLQLSDSGGVAFIVTSMLTTVTSAISGGMLASTDDTPFVGVKIPALGQETRQFYVQAESLGAVAAAVDTSFAKERVGSVAGQGRALGAGVGRGSALGAVPEATYQADGRRPAAAFNHPLQVVSADVHPGRLAPAASSLAAVSPVEVVVGAVKNADGDGSILFRLLERAGRTSTARLDVASLLGTPMGAEEVDFLERPVANGTARLASGAVTVDVPAHGVASVRLRF